VRGWTPQGGLRRSQRSLTTLGQGLTIRADGKECSVRPYPELIWEIPVYATTTLGETGLVRRNWG